MQNLSEHRRDVGALLKQLQIASQQRFGLKDLLTFAC